MAGPEAAATAAAALLIPFSNGAGGGLAGALGAFAPGLTALVAGLDESADEARQAVAGERFATPSQAAGPGVFVEDVARGVLSPAVLLAAAVLMLLLAVALAALPRLTAAGYGQMSPLWYDRLREWGFWVGVAVVGVILAAIAVRITL